MAIAPQWRLRSTIAVVLALAGLVHVMSATTAVFAAGKPKAGAAAKAPAATDGALPRLVQDMVEMIQGAVGSGRIDDLRDAIDWNEMKPDFGTAGPVTDPIAHWKGLSKSGDGKEVLDALGALLSGKPAVVPFGKDLENNRLYVWPAFADTPLDRLTSAETEQLQRLAAPDEIAAMTATGRYAGWRLVLGPDGTWHAFNKGR